MTVFWTVTTPSYKWVQDIGNPRSPSYAATSFLKALAARDNDIPFLVALPYSTIDWSLEDGSTIPIEERDATEVTRMTGKLPDGSLATVQIAPDGTGAANYGFDVTPARLITGFITERGVTPATRDGLVTLYPEHRKTQAE